MHTRVKRTIARHVAEAARPEYRHVTSTRNVARLAAALWHEGVPAIRAITLARNTFGA